MLNIVKLYNSHVRRLLLKGETVAIGSVCTLSIAVDYKKTYNVKRFAYQIRGSKEGTPIVTIKNTLPHITYKPCSSLLSEMNEAYNNHHYYKTLVRKGDYRE